MSRVLLISSNGFVYPYPVYPLGMAVIASALSKNGHDVCQFDFLTDENPMERLIKVIKEYSPDYAGISIRNIDEVDSLGNNIEIFKNEKEIVKVIRKYTDVPIIIGGSAFSAMPEEILKFIDADYGIVGGGEKPICSLIENLNNGIPVRRILRQGNNPPDAQEVMSPLWEKSIVDYYLDKSGLLNIQTKRGCPYKCSYCIYPHLEGSRFRFRDPESVIYSLERAVKLYNARSFFFTDSVFNDPNGHYLDLAEKIISSGLKIKWAGYFRPKGLGVEELRLLKRSGLLFLS